MKITISICSIISSSLVSWSTFTLSCSWYKWQLLRLGILYLSKLVIGMIKSNLQRLFAQNMPILCCLYIAMTIITFHLHILLQVLRKAFSFCAIFKNILKNLKVLIVCNNTQIFNNSCNIFWRIRSKQPFVLQQQKQLRHNSE